MRTLKSLAMIAGLALGASALAAGVDDDGAKDQDVDIRQGFDQPLNAQALNGQGGRSSTTVITANNGQHEYKYESKDGVVRVSRDGKQLTKQQYRERDGKLEFLDGAGKVEYSLDMPKQDNDMRGIRQMHELRLNGQDALNRARVLALGPDGVVLNRQDNPPVMLGVSISTQENDNGKGLAVQDVNEDGPAEKAGIRGGDRILFLDGKEVNSLTDLRTQLKGFKPGQKVDVKVDRDGQERIFTVELVKFEEADATAWNFNNNWNNNWNNEDDQEEMQERLEKLMGQQLGLNMGHPQAWLGLEGFTFTDRDVKDMKMVEEELEAATKVLKEAEGKVLEAQQQAQLAERLTKALAGVKRVREIQHNPNSRARGMIIQPPVAPRAPRARGWQQDNGEEDLQTLQDQLREMREQLKQMREEMQERKP